MSHRTRYRHQAPTVASRRRMRQIARAWRAAGWLADAAAVVVGRDQAQELLHQVRAPLRRAARCYVGSAEHGRIQAGEDAEVQEAMQDVA